jgi:hypothetical protein
MAVGRAVMFIKKIQIYEKIIILNRIYIYVNARVVIPQIDHLRHSRQNNRISSP